MAGHTRTPADIRALVHPTFRHRILIGYRAEADGISVDDVIDRLLEQVRFAGEVMSAAVANSTPSEGRTQTAVGRTSFIDPPTVMRIKNLQLRARAVVEGFFAGIHRSPYHGFSVEFSEYRAYTPGDDPRYLDWRLFARSDRYCVKRFEDETNLLCYLVVDMSRSMGYGSGTYTKCDYARTMAASLAHLLIHAARRRRRADV